MSDGSKHKFVMDEKYKYSINKIKTEINKFED
jgi:hypothetical protein